MSDGDDVDAGLRLGERLLFEDGDGFTFRMYPVLPMTPSWPQRIERHVGHHPS
jgi:hypothetical protein